MGGGPTLETSIESLIKGKTKNSKLVATMNGNIIQSPTSKPSDLFCSFGTTPPSVAALISSSVASHDFIFSFRDAFAALASSVVTSVTSVTSSSTLLRRDELFALTKARLLLLQRLATDGEILEGDVVKALQQGTLMQIKTISVSMERIGRREWFVDVMIVAVCEYRFQGDLCVLTNALVEEQSVTIGMCHRPSSTIKKHQRKKNVIRNVNE
jgi:hypothetical protein